LSAEDREGWAVGSPIRVLTKSGSADSLQP
jgi:hypothetical protein